MKKKKFSAKLNLNKQSVTRLNNTNLGGVKGGGPGGNPTVLDPNDSATYCGCDTWHTYCNQYSCGCIESVNYPCAYTDQPGCTQ